MRELSNLSRRELIEVIQNVIDILYLDSTETEYYYTKNKVWDVDRLKDIEYTLDMYDIKPYFED